MGEDGWWKEEEEEEEVGRMGEGKAGQKGRDEEQVRCKQNYHNLF